MNHHAEMGMNRTGIATSPLDGASLLQAAKKAEPSAAGDAALIADARVEMAHEVEPIGSMPPPASLRGAAKSALKAMRGMNANVFLDKLGERLAFERTGVRLYDGLLSKLDAFGTWPGGPTRAELEEHRRQELEHFEMMRAAIAGLGADPTVMTPSADVKAVASLGILQVVSDPRTDLYQCLDVMLTAELTDNDAFEVLVQLARDLGQTELAGEFQGALLTERRHVARVRGWVSARLGDLMVGRPSPSPGRSRMKSNTVGARGVAGKPRTKRNGRTRHRLPRSRRR